VSAKTNELDRQVIALAAQRLIAKLPLDMHDDPELRGAGRGLRALDVPLRDLPITK
jgi:hypothetical protein